MEAIGKGIIKSRNHPSVLLIKNKVNNLYNTCSFEEIEIIEVIKEICPLNPKMARTDNDIPLKILRISKETCAPFLKSLFSNFVTTGILSEKLKLADSCF